VGAAVLLALSACAGGDADTAEAWGEDRQVEVPAGTFTMGCDPAADPTCELDEQPAHDVSVAAFAIDRLEVQVGDYGACQDAHKCTPPVTAAGAPDNPSLPMTSVSVDQAEAFCTWAGKRLPTEAEWEKAARGTDGRLYPWGDDAPDCERAAMPGCRERLQPADTHPTGASPYGALNMSGNAWEWVSDYYADNWYAESDSSNPVGPDPTGLRVVRGASHFADTTGLRVSNREPAITGASCPLCGFRCVEDR
jgi:formylglycine-generating enzyme required for sulfatase activity